MQEALGSIPNTAYTRHGVVLMPVISALKEAEAGELQAQGQPCLYNKLEASLSYRGPRLKENKKEKRKPRRLCWESWLKAKAGAAAQRTRPLFS